jgi:FG-GAP repeat protein
MSARFCLALALFLVASAATGSSFTYEAQLLARDGTADDELGFSVSVSGDTAVVGAALDDAAGVNSGSAYVFVRSGTTWTFQQKLVASNEQAGDGFGSAVSVSGDTIVVGSPSHDGAAGPDAGSAYVFVRSGATWTEQQQLLAADEESGQGFGSSVSLSGETALVGSPLDTTAGGISAGSAYVYVRSGSIWTQQQKLLAPDAEMLDQFGNSVSLSGETALVGAFFDAAPAFGQGSAYVFIRSGGVWSFQQKLTAADGADVDFFGISVSLSGDTAAVGAALADTPAAVDSGAAYVFVRSGAAWSQQQKLVGSDSAQSDLFGAAVAAATDEVVVGASDHDVGTEPDAGAAYVFGRAGTVWTEQRILLAPGGADSDNFGGAVAVMGDTVLAGAAGDDTAGGADAGSAHVFRGQVPVELLSLSVE